MQVDITQIQIAGEGSELLRAISVDEPLDGFTHCAKRAAYGSGQTRETPLQVLPQPLNRVEFRTVGWQVEQHNVGRDDEGFGDMGGGVVEHKEVEAICILAAEVIEEDLKAGTVESR